MLAPGVAYRNAEVTMDVYPQDLATLNARDVELVEPVKSAPG